jgi:hypothetical protein
MPKNTLTLRDVNDFFGFWPGELGFWPGELGFWPGEFGFWPGERSPSVL